MAEAQHGGSANPEPEVLRNLMVNYIPTTIDELQLRQLFEMYGPIESVKIVCDRETRTSRGYGFVKYRFAFSAIHAIQYLNGYPLMNKRLKVAYANQAEAQKALASQHPGAGEAQAGAYGAGAGGANPYAAQAMAQQPGAMGQQGVDPAAAAAAQAGGMDASQQAAWMQQVGYMQQLAALQMMQYQQAAMQQAQQQQMPGAQQQMQMPPAMPPKQ